MAPPPCPVLPPRIPWPFVPSPPPPSPYPPTVPATPPPARPPTPYMPPDFVELSTPVMFLLGCLPVCGLQYILVMLWRRCVTGVQPLEKARKIVSDAGFDRFADGHELTTACSTTTDQEMASASIDSDVKHSDISQGHNATRKARKLSHFKFERLHGDSEKPVSTADDGGTMCEVLKTRIW